MFTDLESGLVFKFKIETLIGNIKIKYNGLLAFDNTETKDEHYLQTI